MGKLAKLENTCDAHAESAIASKRKLIGTAGRIRTNLEDLLRSDEAIVGAFIAGVLADQIGDYGSGDSELCEDGSGRRRETDHESGIDWTQLLIRAMLPLAIRQLAGSGSADSGGTESLG